MMWKNLESQIQIVIVNNYSPKWRCLVMNIYQASHQHCDKLLFRCEVDSKGGRCEVDSKEY